MKNGPDIARLAALIGDPARANMLLALMSGAALTVTELGQEAGVGVSTASAHLARLQDGALVSMRKSGRHKYFKLASDEVASLLEHMMGLAASGGHMRSRPGPRDPALRHARVCYNHLAGAMGVQLYDSLLARGHLVHMENGVELTRQGHDFALNFGIAAEDLHSHPRKPLCRDCLDWSARRNHLAGRLGRAYLARMIALGWASASPDSRALRFSPRGQRGFVAAFPPLAKDAAPTARESLDAAADSP